MLGIVLSYLPTLPYNTPVREMLLKSVTEEKQTLRVQAP